MNTRSSSIIRIAAIFSFLSCLSIVLGVPIAATLRGVGGPGLIDFGNGEVLTQLAMGAPRTVWVDTLALIGPVLALPAGAGWYLILENERPLAAFGVLLWYLAMVFVITQDAVQLAVVTTLPSAYVAADASTKTALEAFGGSLAYVIEVIATVSHYLNTGALFILSAAMLRSPGIPRWIGVLTRASAIVGLFAVAQYLPRLDAFLIAVPISILLFVLVCIPALGVVMWRWKAES